MSERNEQLEAGISLDALIAGKVMGLKSEDWRSRCFVLGHKFDDYEYDPSGDPEYRESGWCYTCDCSVSVSEKLPPAYSTDIAAAWEVVEKLAAPGFHFDLRASGGGTFDACLLDNEDCYLAEVTDIATAPLAICLVAIQSFSVSSEAVLND